MIRSFGIGLFAFLFSLVSSQDAQAQLQINTTVSPQQIASTIAGNGVIVQNVQLNCPNCAYGTFDATNANVGITQGALLTTGFAGTKAACSYSLTVGDGQNNGWSCNEIWIYVNGVPQGPYTDTTTWGSTFYNIIVPDGATLDIEYVATGASPCDSVDHWYQFNDANFNLLSEGGNNPFGAMLGPIPVGIVNLGTVNCNGQMLYGADGPNDFNTADIQHNTVVNDPDLTALEPQATNDVCILEFDIIPACDTLQINYVFASEEYLDFVCSNFNDAFGFFISGPGIAGPFTNGAINMAVVPGTGDFVGINTVNDGSPTPGSPCTPFGAATPCPCNAGFYVDNGEGNNCPGPLHCTDSTFIRYDGFTVPLLAQVAVQPCQTYHMKLIIADAGDWSLDSGVFLTLDGLNCPNANSTLNYNLQDTILEGCRNGLVEMYRGGDSSAVMGVDVTIIGGSATDQIDYTGVPDSVIFAPLDTFEVIDITGILDGVSEGQENIQIVLTYDLCAGTSFSDTIEFVILEEFPTAMSFTPEDCGVCNGTATITAGSPSAAPYTYDWVTAGNQSTQTATNLCSGTHIVNITDSFGCAASDTVVVSAIGGPQMTIATQIESCQGAGDGSITVTPVGGGTSFVYAIDANQQNSNVFGNLSAGTYTISIIDTVQNCQTDSIITLAIAPCCLGITTASVDASCSTNCDGSITATESNSYGTVTTNWASITGAPNGAGSPINNLCVGTYIVAITDSFCTVADTVTINAPAAPVVTIADTAICAGGTATITANVNGINPPYTYLWNNGATAQTQTISTTVDSMLIVIASDANGCSSVPDTAQITLLPGLNLTVSADQTVCEGDAITMDATVTGGIAPYNYQWTFSADPAWTANTASVTLNAMQSGTYYVTVDDDCENAAVVDSIQVTVNAYPVPSFTPSDTASCLPLPVVFTNTTDPNLIGSVLWDFGDGNTSTITSPNHVYNTNGCFDISLTVTSPAGCATTITEPQLICAYAWPVADFGWTPEPISILSPFVNFQNLSTGAISYEWFIDSLSVSNDADPNYDFGNVPESYNVCLVATNEWNCTDTICATVVVNDEELVFVPNAFTPDGDGVNDFFFPVLSFEPTEYEFTVYNRWGEIMLDTDSPNVPWDGRYLGEYVESEVYVWKLKVSGGTEDMQKKEYYGHVTVVR